jgi:hypothetical protein
MRIIVLFNLKPGVTPAAYEEWARTRDIPGVRSLPSIDSFRIFRSTGLLGQPGTTAPYAYTEVIDVIDMDGFWKDVAGEASQKVAAEMRDYVDGEPVFITTEEVF